MLFGYARVSTTDQDVAIQIAALEAAGCTADHIRAEKKSGTSLAGRDELQNLIAFMRAGDTLVVTRIDRLARSIADLSVIVQKLTAKGVALRTTEQSVDTSTPEGKMFLGMLGVFAEFETNIRRERQLEGIAKAKAEGVYTGGKRRLDRDAIRAAKAAGRPISQIAREHGCSRQAVYDVLGEEAEALQRAS